MRLLVILAFIALTGYFGCTTNYYVVRHAEKANSSSNTPLSAAGLQRAEDLKDYLADKGIDNIYTSQYLRTQQTAAPTANQFGLTAVEYDVPAELSNLITKLKSHGDNRSVLVVNHSNTVPVIIDSLMKSPQGITISETDFDNIYKVKVSRFLSVNRSLIQGTYGQPTN